MGLKEAVKSCFSKYVTFSGRASRSEYWYWTLFSTSVTLFSVIISVLLGSGMKVTLILSWGLLLPDIAVSIRRMHDTNHTAGVVFWVYIPTTIGTILGMILDVGHQDKLSFEINIISSAMAFVPGLIMLFRAIRMGTTGDTVSAPIRWQLAISR